MNDTFDRWVQRVLVASMLALAVVLVGMGVALYAPQPHTPWSATR